MKRADFLNESLVQSAKSKALAKVGKNAPTAQKNPKTKPAQHAEALVDFMMKSWQPRDRRLPAPIDDAKSFAARRKALSRRFRGDWLVIPTGHEKVRANDTMYRFRPGSDFFYLTGNVEPDCVLVLEPVRGGHRDILFVEPNPGRVLRRARVSRLARAERDAHQGEQG
jgi:Xaa-Pro aminopeptidase